MHCVQEIHVDVIHPQTTQRLLEIADHGSACEPLAFRIENAALGGDDDVIPWPAAQRLSEYSFGLVGFGRVEEVDAQFESRADQCDGFLYGFARTEPQTTVTPAAQACHRHAKVGPAKRCVLHRRCPGQPVGRMALCWLTALPSAARSPLKTMVVTMVMTPSTRKPSWMPCMSAGGSA